jgi:uncharacterized protein (TIGR02588 family)
MSVRKNALEWSVFAAALLIVGACVGLLAVAMARDVDAPPELIVTAGAAERTAAGYRVPVRVKNEGDGTAADVHLGVTLEQSGREVERVELTLPFVPRHSTREGMVVFRHDPSCCTIAVRALGFEIP